MSTPRDILVQALQDVEEANTPDDLREIALSKVFDLRVGAVAAPPATVPSAGRSGPAVPLAGGSNADLDAIGAIASRAGVDRDRAAEVFTVDDGEVELIVPVGKLASATATATKEIALLAAGGRQAAGSEEFTTWDHIRKVCTDFRKLDSGNFAKSMREMDDVFSTRKQADRKYAVRLAKPGWERFADLVRRLGGGE